MLKLLDFIHSLKLCFPGLSEVNSSDRLERCLLVHLVSFEATNWNNLPKDQKLDILHHAELSPEIDDERIGVSTLDLVVLHPADCDLELFVRAVGHL